MPDPQKEIAKLRAELAEHDRLYYKDAQPKIDDQAYDRLKAQLAELEAANPEFNFDESPTQSVGDDRLEAFESYRHRKPMLSLDNTYSSEELIEFGQRLSKRFPDQALQYLVEPKIDGVAVSLTYEAGQFVRAVSRGNGVEGDDITQNVKGIEGLPMSISGAPNILEVRGEIYMRHEEFERINAVREAEGQQLYANPRNLAAGTIKLLDPTEARSRKLNIVLYGIGACEPTHHFARQDEIRVKLQTWRFPVLENHWLVSCFNQALASIKELKEIRNAFEYPTDGAVIKLNDCKLQEQAGYTAKAPRWATSFKFESEKDETILNQIDLQISRGGTITPVAKLNTVQLAGTRVSSATLHNEDEIIRKDIRPGDSVLVQKAGEIIPQILKVNLGTRPHNSMAFNIESEINKLGLKAARAPNESVWREIQLGNTAQRQRLLQHFAGRQCMDIENLGTAVIEQLVELGLVQNPADLYKLTEKQLLELDKFAEKSAQNLLTALAASKQRELWQLVHGLGIPHVGKQSAKDLEVNFDSLDAIARASKEQLEAVDGIGSTMAQSINTWFTNTENHEMIEQLRSHGLNFQSARQKQMDGPLTGKIVVLTGTLPSLTREEATKLIENAGGRTSSSVSKKCDYVLTGASAGSKYEKAQKLGIPILNEDEFRILISKTN